MNPENSVCPSESSETDVNAYPATFIIFDPESQETVEVRVEHDSTQYIVSEVRCSDRWPKPNFTMWKNGLFQGIFGETFLHWAVGDRDSDLVREMIKTLPISCLDIQNKSRQTALHLAVLTNQPKIVRLLVRKGAGVQITDSQGNTPMHLACAHKNTDCVHELLATNDQFDFEKPNVEGKRCVHIAVEASSVETLRCLVVAGADIHSKQLNDGLTPFDIAVQRNDVQVINFLVGECHYLSPEADTAFGLGAYYTEEMLRNERRL